MWPGRVSLQGGDQPATPGKTLGLPENSIPIRQQPGEVRRQEAPQCCREPEDE